jgi:aryl-alcohol dehydrogenase-like predicted oxidoreductase
MNDSFTRLLGRSGIEVSPLGMGCWAIGGPAWRGETPIGWGQVDDAESVRAIHRALELGVNFFDTANVYGAGHSLTQGALAWLWARSPQTVPIPGFKTVRQVEENCGTIRFGPLAAGEYKEIEALLGR